MRNCNLILGVKLVTMINFSFSLSYRWSTQFLLKLYPQSCLLFSFFFKAETLSIDKERNIATKLKKNKTLLNIYWLVPRGAVKFVSWESKKLDTFFQIIARFLWNMKQPMNALGNQQLYNIIIVRCIFSFVFIGREPTMWDSPQSGAWVE